MEGLNGLINAIGALAESMVLFYNQCREAGADVETALRLTEIFANATMHGAAEIEEESE